MTARLEYWKSRGIHNDARDMNDNEFRMIQRRRVLAERGRLILEWARDKGTEYKNGGVFPVSLADYYTEKEDVEVAAIVEAIVPNPLSMSPRRIGYITELHNLLGKHPAEMVDKRGFVARLMPDGALDGLLGRMGVQKSDVFNILDWIWEVRSAGASLEIAFLEYAGMRRSCSYMFDLHERIGNAISTFSANVVLVRLCTDSGIGRGVWDVLPAHDVPCPMNADVKKFLGQMYVVKRLGDGEYDEAISYMGWDVTSDFIYSFLACRKFGKEMEEVGKRLRAVVDGNISISTWRKSYKDGALFIPENAEMLEKSRERVRLKEREIREERRRRKMNGNPDVKAATVTRHRKPADTTEKSGKKVGKKVGTRVGKKKQRGVKLEPKRRK